MRARTRRATGRAPRRRPEHDDAMIGTRARGRPRPLHGARSTRTRPTSASLTATRARELRNAGDRHRRPGATSSATPRGDEGSLARIVRIQPRTTLLRRSADDTDAGRAHHRRQRRPDAHRGRRREPRAARRASSTATWSPPTTPASRPLIVHHEDRPRRPGPIPRELRRPRPPACSAARRTTMPARRARARPSSGTPPSPSGTPASASRRSSTPSSRHGPRGRRRERRSPGAAATPRRRPSRCASCRPVGWIIDTPGVRSFGLGHVDPANILRSFTDLAEIAEDCPRGCTHLPDAPDCALIEAVAERASSARPARHASTRSSGCCRPSRRAKADQHSADRLAVDLSPSTPGRPAPASPSPTRTAPPCPCPTCRRRVIVSTSTPPR